MIQQAMKNRDTLFSYLLALWLIAFENALEVCLTTEYRSIGKQNKKNQQKID